MPASSVEHGFGARSCKAVQAIRDLSPPTAFKRKFLAVDLTVVRCTLEEKITVSGAYKCRRQLSGSDYVK